MSEKPSSITPQELASQEGDQPLVIDVRSREEFEAGHVQGACHIPLDELETRLQELPADRQIVTYCNMFRAA